MRASDGLPAFSAGLGKGLVLIKPLNLGESPFKIGDVIVTSGNGGFVGTSAARVKVDDGARVNTWGGAGAQAGKWLIDPNDYSISSSYGGDISGATLSTNLGGGNVAMGENYLWSTYGVSDAGDDWDINYNPGNDFGGQHGQTCVDSWSIPCIRCEGDFGSSAYSDIDFGLSSSYGSVPPGTYVCGNGRTEPGEQCDDGNLSNKDACSTSCRFTASSSSSSSRPLLTLLFCGNGQLDLGEQCDIGAQNSNLPNALCRMDCTPSRCGDQILDALKGESCDDGNAVEGDGCSPACALEQAAGNPSEVLPGSLIELPFVPGSQNQVVPSLPAHGPVGNTGPETVAIMAAGASAGYTWMKIRRKAKKQ